MVASVYVPSEGWPGESCLQLSHPIVHIELDFLGGNSLTTHPTLPPFSGRFWDPQNSKSLSLGSPGSPITKMVAVAGKLWCGCQNRVIVLNTTTLAQEVPWVTAGGRGGGTTGSSGITVAVALSPPQHTLQVGQDGGRSVTCMVSAGSGVWVALQGSAQVRLYHATTYEQLAEADITPPVHKMLAGKWHPGHGSSGCQVHPGKCPEASSAGKFRILSLGKKIRVLVLVLGSCVIAHGNRAATWGNG